MRGKNWVDHDDPGEERVFDLGHEWCREEAQRIRAERTAAADLSAGRSFPGETDNERVTRQDEDDARSGAANPSYRGRFPGSTDVRDGYYHLERKEPYID
jgi:hypothetical protein